MTTAELQAELAAGRYRDGMRLFAKLPKAWGDMEVSEKFDPPSRLMPDEVTVKTYRDYLIVLAEDETDILAQLWRKENDSNCHCPAVLENEIRIICEMIPISAIMCHADALAERDAMVGVEEV